MEQADEEGEEAGVGRAADGVAQVGEVDREDGEVEGGAVGVDHQADNEDGKKPALERRRGRSETARSARQEESRRSTRTALVTPCGERHSGVPCSNQSFRHSRCQLVMQTAYDHAVEGAWALPGFEF